MKNLSLEMTIITESFKKVEGAIFNGRFELDDLTFIKKWCEAIIKITDKTIQKKAAPVQQTTNGNPVPSVGIEENGTPTAVAQTCPRCGGSGISPGFCEMKCSDCMGSGKLRVA